MIVVHTISDLQAVVSAKRLENKRVGFVPTMGALHQGHLSLVQESLNNGDVVVVSIFVNPTQFNNHSDLENYPRTLETDIKLLEAVGCGVVFSPSVEEVYPEKDDRVFNFGSLETVMEGAHRPGHFNGVAQVVSRLFDMVQPDVAYFGEKDFQQLAIIQAMVKQLNYNLKIVPCGTVRENDGLAMSSRNVRLTEEQRIQAPSIYKIISDARTLKKSQSVVELKQWVIGEINKNHELECEYFEIVNSDTLQSVNSWSDTQNLRACVAVFAGDVRLIDNISFI